MEVVLAYIDPGSRSLIVQAVIAGLVAVPIFFRNQITRAIRAVRGDHSTDGRAPSGSDDAPAGQ